MWNHEISPAASSCTPEQLAMSLHLSVSLKEYLAVLQGPMVWTSGRWCTPKAATTWRHRWQRARRRAPGARRVRGLVSRLCISEQSSHPLLSQDWRRVHVAQLPWLHGFVSQKLAQLAACRLLCGGPSEPPAGDCGKSFYPPTVLTDVKPGLLLPEGDTRATKLYERKAPPHITIQFRRNKKYTTRSKSLCNNPWLLSVLVL